MNQQFVHLDTDDTIFFTRQLEFLKAKSYDIKYASLKARALLPVSYEAGPGAETIRYEQFQNSGIAKVIANYADDLPRADIKGKEFIGSVKSLGSSYGYSLQEIRAARYAGKPLEQRRANAAKRAIAQAENQIAWFGNSDYNLGGFLSNPNVSQYTVSAVGTGTPSTLWSGKTSDQILADMNGIVNFIFSNTLGVEQADTLLLPLAQYAYVSATPRSTLSDVTILEFFLQNNPFIKQVDWLNELKGAGAGGLDMMVAYTRDPDHVTLEIPQDFEQLNVQEKGLEYVIPCHQRIGGVILYYPLAVAQGVGI